MLQRLYIENIALIERLELEFGSGFHVLSGETGAGKSIIIDAVNFVLGERANRELIKFGAAKARVEAVFRLAGCERAEALLDEMGLLPEDGELILSRELSQSGKNACRVNGVLVPVSALKSVTDLLVDIHGQHEHQSLLNPEKHISFLDAFDHKRIGPAVEAVNAVAAHYAAVRAERLSGFASEGEREREIDVLRYQINEIAEAKPRAGEEEALTLERALLLNSERIRTALAGAHAGVSGGEGGENESGGLDGGALGALDHARRALREIAPLSKEYETLCARVEEVYYNLEDIGFALRDQSETVEFDPKRLDQIEARLERLSALKRKYGKTAESILTFQAEAEAKLNSLVNAAARMAELDGALVSIKNEYNGFAAGLTELRQKAAEALRAQALAQLGELGLEKADFAVRLTDVSGGEPRENGKESAEFLLTANPGEPLRPLEKVASGGELSRIMLCFKAIFAQSDSIPTLIFDEIDTGISGKAASVVGEKMLGISLAHQVICVTHLAQIAALADVHYAVEKHTDGEHTYVEARPLDEEGKNRRIAQMMDGDSESRYALEHARVLIAKAEELKKGNKSHK